MCRHRDASYTGDQESNSQVEISVLIEGRAFLSFLCDCVRTGSWLAVFLRGGVRNKRVLQFGLTMLHTHLVLQFKVLAVLVEVAAGQQVHRHKIGLQVVNVCV